MEIWDAYNECYEKVGIDLVRGEKIPDGLFHLVSEVIVQHKDGDFLAVQRDFSKQNYPGKYEITAGGSVLKGETVIECAKRELFEETGIVCSYLQQIFDICYINSQSIYFGYFCKVDCLKTDIKLQKNETISYKWIPKDKVVEFVNSSDYVRLHRKRALPYIISKAEQPFYEKSSILGCIVNVTVDRQLGSFHPKHKDIYYPVNYGFVSGIIAPDGKEQDAYILGVSVPIKKFTGKIIAVVHRKNDVEDKWVVVPEDMNFSKQQIAELINFQERYFDIDIIM